MRYRLRTLLIVLALGPPALSFAWSQYVAYRAEQERQRAIVAKYWIDPNDFPPAFIYFAPPSVPDEGPLQINSGRVGCYDTFTSSP